jgi:hypothetical protein
MDKPQSSYAGRRKDKKKSRYYTVHYVSVLVTLFCGDQNSWENYLKKKKDLFGFMVSESSLHDGKAC